MSKYVVLSLVLFLVAGGAFAGNQPQKGEIVFTGGSDRSIAGSDVSCSPDDPNGCNYTAGSSVAMEFRITNASGDSEWVDEVSVTFPAGWTVACNSQDASDSGSHAVSMACTVSSTTVTYTDDDGGYGEIYDGQTWDFTIDVTAPAGTTGSQTVGWSISGDDYGADPHDLTGSTSIVPVELVSFSIE